MGFLKYIKSYKLDLIGILGLFLCFSVLSVLFMAHQGNPILDTFNNNAFIPSQLLAGKVLYKTIISVPYGPFSYQIEALVLKLFGNHLNSIYILGLINSFAIIACIYFISRKFTSVLLSFATSLVILTACVFSYYIFNFAFPYSSAATFALSSFLYSLLFILNFIKSDKACYLYIAALFFGISSCCKFDYMPFGLVFLLILFLQRFSIKQIAITVLSFISVPFISWGFLFLQGLNIYDIYNNFILFVLKFSKTESFKFFYTNMTGLYYNFAFIKHSVYIFLTFIFNFIFLFVYLYFIGGLITNKYRDLIRFNIPKWLQIILFIIFIAFFPLRFAFPLSKEDSYSWLPIATVAIVGVLALIYLIKSIKKRSFKLVFMENMTVGNKMYFILLFSALVSTGRSFFDLNLHLFGTFIFPLVFVANLIFVVEILPNFFHKLDKKRFQTCLFVIVILVAAGFFVGNYLTVKTYLNHPISTNRGVFYTDEDSSITFNGALDYINANIPKDKSILMLPQGPILNFLTGRRAGSTRYYDLIPPIIQTFGEDNIIKEFKKNPPDYIFINNRNSADWGYAFFCRDYAFGICKFISANYEFQKEYGSNTKILIFKRKNS